MAYSETDLQAIEKAIARGVTKVKYADKEVTYSSLDELIRIRDLIKRELGLTKVATKATRYKKGL